MLARLSTSGDTIMPSVAQQIGDLHLARELDGKRRDFAQLVRYFMLGRAGAANDADLAIQDRANERVVSAIRASLDPLSLASVGGQLSPFQLLSNAFLNSLSVSGAFDQMLGATMKLPLRTKIVAVTSTAIGASLAEADVKRFSSLQLSATDLDVSKVAATLALSREVLVSGGDGVMSYLERELRAAVAVATDTKFLALITAGATSFPASGVNIPAIRQDIRTLVQQIGLGAASRLFLVTTPDILASWSTVGGDNGPAFPGLNYNSGSAAGIPVIPSDGCPSGQVILADASGIAAGSDGVRVDSAAQASLQMDSAPDSPPIAATSYVNLWTQNMVAARVERFFGAKVVRSNSVAYITGANYSGNSPG
jgi:hypothetical protein